jgi:hypothetical protein
MAGIFRKLRNRKEKPKTHTSNEQLSAHSTALAKLNAIGERYGISSTIRKHTLDKLEENEVISIKSNESDKICGLMAYACAKIGRSEEFASVAQRIVDEAIVGQKRELDRTSKDMKEGNCVLALQKQAGSNHAEIHENLKQAQPLIQSALEELADLYNSAGEAGLGLVVVDRITQELGCSKKPTLYVINSSARRISLDLSDILDQDIAIKRLIEQKVGHIVDARLIISSDVSSKLASERPVIEFEVYILGLGEQVDAGPATMLPWESAESYGKKRETVAERKEFKGNPIRTPPLAKDSVYFAGEGSGPREFDISSLLPTFDGSLLDKKQLVLFFRDDALIIADIGSKAFKGL